MHVEAGVRSLEHHLGLILVEEAAAHEEPEHGAAEGLAQGGAVIGRPAGPAHEGAVGPETAVGHDEVEMGMPVGQGAVGLLRSGSPVVARTPAVTMRAASRARSPRRARR